MIKDYNGRTPRFVLLDDPSSDDPDRKLMLNQFTGMAKKCQKSSAFSMRVACIAIDERPTRTSKLRMTCRCGNFGVCPDAPNRCRGPGR